MLPPPPPHFAKALKGIHLITKEYEQITTVIQNHSSGWTKLAAVSYQRDEGMSEAASPKAAALNPVLPLGAVV